MAETAKDNDDVNAKDDHVGCCGDKSNTDVNGKDECVGLSGEGNVDDGNLLRGYYNDNKSNVFVDPEQEELSKRRPTTVLKDLFTRDKRQLTQLIQEKTFIDKDHFRQVLQDYILHLGFVLKSIKNDNMRYTARSADDNCKWRIRVTLLSDNITFMVKTYRGPHTCGRVQ